MLGRLPRLAHENVIVGTESSDDAGVVRLGSGLLLAATVDFITPLVDDAATFGAIAAANAVSDVYAMGGAPLFALSVACFPSKTRPVEELGAMLRGGVEKLGEAGTPVVGGHTVEDVELKLGYAVVGRCEEGRLWRNNTAQPGDELLLTKRLGTGILSTAARARRPVGRAWDDAVAQMATLNRAAAEALQAEAVHAATDITGFGLAGHAMEMAAGSGATLRIRMKDVPVLDGAREWARAGFRTRARDTNLDYVRTRVSLAPELSDVDLEILLDAQTSGGLLLAVAPGGSAAERLRAAGVPCERIGSVDERAETSVTFSRD